jgi:hypothetical protein
MITERRLKHNLAADCAVAYCVMYDRRGTRDFACLDGNDEMAQTPVRVEEQFTKFTCRAYNDVEPRLSIVLRKGAADSGIDPKRKPGMPVVPRKPGAVAAKPSARNGSWVVYGIARGRVDGQCQRKSRMDICVCCRGFRVWDRICSDAFFCFGPGGQTRTGDRQISSSSCVTDREYY